jgi:membrane-associated protein
MTATVPHEGARETSSATRHTFLGLAVVRAALAGIALLLAPWLYREHTGLLVLLRPTKEVFLFAGFLVRKGDASLPIVVVAALPFLLVGVWVFFGLGRAYSEELAEADLPGIAGRVLPKHRIDNLRDALEARGTRVVFLGRLAAFPSSLMAAAAGASGVSWREFLVADIAGAMVSFVALLAIGYGLGETYESAGPWVTVAGVIVLMLLAWLVGRALVRSAPKSRTSPSSQS